MREAFKIIGLGLVFVTVGLFILLFVVMLGYTFKQAMSKRYAISTPAETYYTDSYTEKDGCVQFETYYGLNRACGSYSIRDRN